MELIVNSPTLGWAFALLLAGAVSRGTYLIARCQPLDAPQGGRQGQERHRARQSALFSVLEPTLRAGGGLVARWFQLARRLPFLRQQAEQFERWQNQQLVWAGQPAGLHRFELLALSAGLMLVGSSLGWLASREASTWVLPAGLVGLALPNVRLQTMSRERFAEMSRELPAAIDLIALAMNAGQDFPGAIRRVIDGRRGVVAQELGEVLRSIDWGLTRRGALLALKDRMPIREVKELVRAVLLAEQKGASITEALSQQAQASRQRRSVRAEEAAARAGVLLLVPMMLLMGCIMIMLIAPLMLSGAGL